MKEKRMQMSLQEALIHARNTFLFSIKALEQLPDVNTSKEVLTSLDDFVSVFFSTSF